MRRRLFGLIATLALARLSFGGLMTPCSFASESAAGHTNHNAAAVIISASHGDHEASCGSGRESACTHAGDAGCAAMSSCGSAFEPLVSAPETVLAPPGHVVPAVVADLRVPPRPPDTPPPRA